MWGIAAVLAVFGVISTTSATAAQAEDLVMPYACTLAGGRPVLSPSAEMRYPVIGRRVEQSHAVCADAGTKRCELMMVHQFSIMCGGVKTAWSDIAASARALKIATPKHLPAGYAPVSLLAGRFLLPAPIANRTVASTAPFDGRVMRENLSPDGVVYRAHVRTAAITADDIGNVTGSIDGATVVPVAFDAASGMNASDTAAPSSVGGWQTTVRTELDGIDVAPTVAADSSAFTVAGMVGGLLVALLTGSLFVASRLGIAIPYPNMPPRVPMDGTTPDDHSAVAHAVFKAWSRWVAFATAMFEALRTWAQGLSNSAEHMANDEGMANALRRVESRLAEVELQVATLPPEQLLASVLRSELDELHVRFRDMSTNAHRIAPNKTAAKVRAALRDLDRIDRIACSSTQNTGFGGAFSAGDEDNEALQQSVPETVGEAYQVLGINADAPASAAKKLVDALRMTWHPDHARDEADRQRRESRMKQINAAWDLVKSRHTAAAA